MSDQPSDPTTAPALEERQPAMGPDEPLERERRRRPWLRFTLLLAVVAAVVLGVLALVPALSARSHLESARQDLEQARDLLLGGDVDGATAAFERAKEAFSDARAAANSPVLRAVGWIPLAGRSVDAVAVLSEAGERTASAGVELVGAIGALDGGIGSLAPEGGRLPVDAIGSLHPAASRARAELETALARVESLPTSWLVGPIADARDAAVGELREAVATAKAADALSGALPRLAGSDGTRRYFVAVQTPAELRGTGGFLGAYSIMTAEDGRLSMSPMRSITSLRDLAPADAPPPPDGFVRPFDQFGGPGFWRNLNMVPHAPTAARLIESLYETVTGETLDGVIFVDPQALADLLLATGPVDAPTLGRTLEAGTVVDYLANEAYLEFGDQTERKKVLGAAALTVLTRFLDGTDPVAALRSLTEAASGGHLVLHSTDPEVQAALEEAGVAGVVDAPAGDYFAFFASNADATKVDYYLDRGFRYDVELDASGGSTAQAEMTVENGAPVDAQPSYVFGPYPGTGLGPGDSRSFVAAYCAPGCRLEGATLDDEPVGLESHRERGIPLFTTFVLTEPGTTSALGLELGRSSAWIGTELGGTYRLTLRGQATVRPTAASVRIQVPPGMRVVQTNVPMDVASGVATWNGTLGQEQEFVIRFQRPFFGRLWTEIVNVLNTSVF